MSGQLLQSGSNGMHPPKSQSMRFCIWQTPEDGGDQLTMISPSALGATSGFATGGGGGISEAGLEHFGPMKRQLSGVRALHRSVCEESCVTSKLSLNSDSTVSQLPFPNTLS